MKIRFEPRTHEDLLWFREYYKEHFPQGGENALERYTQALDLLREHPLAGHPSRYVDGLRDLSVAKTPFVFIYEVDMHEKIITIWMVYDTRQRAARF
jgi:plasmid stabilization system protein ParE